jgi:putative tryptophan/tyrosine transport system substrate-binding protein
MMDRRGFIVGGIAALAAPLSAEAQHADRNARIGYLSFNVAAADPHNREAFLHGLRELGYVEGRNFLIEYWDAAGKAERLPALAAELVGRKVDVIVAAGGTLGALAAKQATTTIPIVFPAAGDPVEEGLVASLARPGGNLTGLSVVSWELVGKSLELLKQVVPGLSTVAFFLKPDAMPEHARKNRVKAAEVTARTLGVRLYFVEAREPEDFDRAFSDMTRVRAGAMYVAVTPMFDTHRRRLVELAARNRLPTVYAFRGWAEDGGLMSYGPDIADMFRRTATYVDKILKGVKPGEIPVEQPTKFEFVVNRKTAKALGLTIPPSLLARADQVIE